MKRYKNHPELAHAWANGLSMDGVCGNMYFNDNKIFSFGSHYEIARIVAAPNGLRFAFINSNNGWGSYTGKHTNHVYHAIRHGIRIVFTPFFVHRGWQRQDYFDESRMPEVIDLLMAEVEERVKAQLRARESSYQFEKAERTLADVVVVCDSFNIPIPRLPDNWEKAREKAESLRAATDERNRARQAQLAEQERERLADWLRGEWHGQLYNSPVHLRYIDGGQRIQTTKGATVSTEAAKAMLARLRAKQAQAGEKIDGYIFVGSDDNKVVIGCHKIEWEVINQFFK